MGAIDLRSDTVTRPSAGMRAAMANADVGDDVYGEDPTVALLEQEVAVMCGKEAALFTPTGSMANVLAVAALAAPGDEVLCESRAHIVRAEVGAHGFLNQITTRTWAGSAVDVDAIEELVAPDMGPYFVASKAISIENTHNFNGGEVTDLATLKAVRALADRLGLQVHLDGARLWNAEVATGESLADLASVADTLSVCLSKGLGAPVGSLVVGNHEVIAQARVRRKRLGGGMRQVGILAAAGRYALEHHRERLADDHRRAKALAHACGLDPDLVHSNVVTIDVPDARAVVAAAAEQGILIGAVGPKKLRLLTHLDIGDDDTEQVMAVLPRLLSLTE